MTTNTTESDKRLAQAVAILKRNERGRQVLDHFRIMADPASGLDSAGMAALVTITREFCENARRDFLHNL